MPSLCHQLAKAIAIGLTTDASPGGPDKLKIRCDEVGKQLGVSVLGASQADYEALRTLGATRVGIVTPFNPTVDAIVKENTEAAGFEVVAIKGTKAPSLPAICETLLILLISPAIFPKQLTRSMLLDIISPHRLASRKDATEEESTNV